MSLDAYAQVWKNSKITDPRALLVLLAIADYARDDGTNAYSPNERMADKARLKVRGLQKVYEKLVKAGELVVEWGAGPTSYTKGGAQKLNLLHVVYQDGSNAEVIGFIRARIAKGQAPPKGDERQDTPSAKGMSSRTPPMAEGGEPQDTPHILNGISNTKHTPPTREARATTAEQRRLPGTGSTRRQGSGKASRGKSGPVAASPVKGHAPIPETYFRQMHALCFLTTPETERLLTKPQRGQVAGVLGALAEAGVDLARLGDFRTWWVNNWRSKERDTRQYVPPRPIQVQELWMTAMAEFDRLKPPDRARAEVETTNTLHEAMLRRAGSYGADKKER